MKLITFEDIKSLGISPQECYCWASSMIENKKMMMLPPKVSIKPAEGVFCNVMPSIIPDLNGESWGGVKIVTRYPERNPSLDSRILLFDAEDGDFLALMDGNWITAMRTGAVAAHSILQFAVESFTEIGIIGLGNTARATLIVLAELLRDRPVHIKLMRYKGQEEQFIERFKAFTNLQFSVVDDYCSAVKGSEVVISAITYADRDLCTDDMFDEGVCVVPIHTLGFTNCDLFFDKVYADDESHVCHFKNFQKFNKFAEVGDVVNGLAKGRENRKERILVYNIGISIHDVYFAGQIYNRLKNSKQCLEIDMEEPKSKFWI